MTLVTLNQLGNTMDDIRQSVLNADGPEYGLTCGKYRTRRIYDWSRRRWRKVRIAEIGGKQPIVEPVPVLPDVAIPMVDQTITLVCEWLERVGPQSRRSIIETFGVSDHFAAQWATKCPEILTRIPVEKIERRGPQTLYGAAEGWRDAYERRREGATKQKLNDSTAAILRHIKDNPGVTRRELAQAFDMEINNVRGRERTLMRYDLIRQEGSGSDTQSWPAESENSD